MTDITQSALKKLIQYNPDTGVFTWKKRPQSEFKNNDLRICNRWNTIYAGKPAGCSIKTMGKLYTQIYVKGFPYKAHHLAFIYMTGSIPAQHVDHIDGDGQNNKWSNLREATPSQNAKNRKRRTDNTSGYLGVSKVAKCKSWMARINVNGNRIYLGSFKTKEEAIKARQEAEKSHGYHPNHNRDNEVVTC